MVRSRAKGSATLGEALLAERERRKMTQRDAAQDLGISQPVFSAWENDQNEPGGVYLPQITAWLRVPEAKVGELLYWSKITRAEIELQAAARRGGRS